MHRLTVLVTGGSQGIGNPLCREFAQRGAVVIVHARGACRAQAAAHRLVRRGADPELVHPVHADFRCLAQIHRLAEEVRRESGQLDVLVNNAGSMEPRGLTDDAAQLLGWEYGARAESPASAESRVGARAHPARMSF